MTNNFVLYLPSAHSRVQQNFCLTVGSSYSLKTSFVTMFADTQYPKAKINTNKIKFYTGGQKKNNMEQVD